MTRSPYFLILAGVVAFWPTVAVSETLGVESFDLAKKSVLARSALGLTEVAFYSVRAVNRSSDAQGEWPSYDARYSLFVGTEPTAGRALMFFPQSRKLGDPPDEALRRFGINMITPVKLSEFGAQLDMLASKVDQKTLLYIHGYRTTFTYSLINAARLRLDTDNKRTIVFSWPGDVGNNIVTGYFDAQRMEVASLKYLPPFLRQVSEVGKMNVVAHSMGARLFYEAVESIKEVPSAEVQSALLMAPDISLNDFLRRKPIWRKYVNETYVFCNEDAVLMFSTFAHMRIRLGTCHDAPEPIPGVVVSYQRNVVGFLQHGYFVDTPHTLAEIHDITAK